MIVKLKKWLSGEITWQEEKELRRQAMEDDFLADALEGYEQFPSTNHVQKIHQLNRQIRQKSENRTTTFLSKAIAAALLVIISAGAFWWINTTIMTSAPQDLAYETAPKSTEELMPIEDKFSQAPKTTESPQESSTQESTTSISIKTPSTTTASQTPRTEAIVSKMETTKSTLPPQELQIIEEPERIVLQDEPEMITSNKMEKSKEIASMEDIQTADAPISNQPPILPAQKEQTAASEEIAYEEIKAPITTARRTIPRAESLTQNSALGIQELTPSTSFQNVLNGFVHLNLKYPKKAKRNNITGVVRLSYQVNDSGQVEKIHIIDSLGYGCEKEAIRLLRLFPFPKKGMPLDTCTIAFE